jgi:hypothetical protein
MSIRRLSRDWFLSTISVLRMHGPRVDVVDVEQRASSLKPDFVELLDQGCRSVSSPASA